MSEIDTSPIHHLPPSSSFMTTAESYGTLPWVQIPKEVAEPPSTQPVPPPGIITWMNMGCRHCRHHETHAVIKATQKQGRSDAREENDMENNNKCSTKYKFH